MIDITGQDQAQASEVDFAALQPGQTIGRYEIVAILGQGGFGITYRARDAQLHRDVAIKEYLPSALAVRQDGITVLPRSTKMSDDFTWGRQRFVEEGRTLATLARAPAIVRVFDFLEANGTAYIVMELAPGDTLESRLKDGRTLGPAEIDRILWPLLDGLEQVHATGFLHRDIKPANILLSADGSPTLIDFGASRAAMAGRTTAMTAIFTPGYAASEQFTSAKQGPWTDIYGLSATIYHAITGIAPPSAFDRLLEDEFEPLARRLPQGFAPGLLVGIDAGLAVRASDRPQSIAGWRPILGQTGAIDRQATVALGKTTDRGATVVVRGPSTAQPSIQPAPSIQAPAATAKKGTGLWIGLAAAVLAALAAGGYFFSIAKPPASPQVATGQPNKAAQGEDAKQKAMAEEAERHQIEQETRAKIEAEMAARQQAAAVARQQTEADAAARRKAEEDERRSAEAGEVDLHLGLTDRQHIQVALTALGFNTNGSDGVLGGHSRDMISAWQKSHNYSATGFLTGPQNQALLREAAPAVAKFDDDQKKTDEAKAKADVAAAAPKAAAPAASTPAAAASAAHNAPAAAGTDGLWRGTYHCSANRAAGPFTMTVQFNVVSGAGNWIRPGAGPGTMGNQSVSIRISGSQVTLTRFFLPSLQADKVMTASLFARYEGNTITGTGTEVNGRTCDVILTR